MLVGYRNADTHKEQATLFIKSGVECKKEICNKVVQKGRDMQQFVILAYDATDDGALARRMACREAHTKAMAQMRAQGNMLCGLALLDDTGKMIGSNVVVNFPTRANLDAWLAQEPYIAGKVWENITIINAKLGDSFKDLIK
jgi:uncharacterized protein YciI